MRILIVDGDQITCLVTRKRLEKLGYFSEIARSGEEAWTILQAHTFDVVISDWVMPGIDGLDLCRAVRARYDRTANLPYTYFVLLTTLTSKESRVEAIRSGIDDYLTKPIDPYEIFLRLIIAERISALHRRIAEQAADAERLNGALYAAIRRDPLTGVGNRHLLSEATEYLCASFVAAPRPLAVMLVDIDYFKIYNNIYLHVQGDVALRDVACALDSVARHGGLDSNCGVFRFGGEEFVALVDGLDEPGAFALAESLRQAVEALEIAHTGNPPFGVVTVSVGLALLDLGRVPLTPLAVREGIREADRALFRAKDSGRNRVVIAAATETLIR